ncbi:MAG: ribonuclease R [Clostridia bacterium]|nr:ribonuclease R [Clostridia bacterium]
MKEKKKDMNKNKQVILDLFMDPHYKPMKEKELAILLQIPKKERELLKEVLESLMSEGKIELSKRGKYSIGKPKHLTGKFTANQNGFGFVEVEGLDEDLFIGDKEMHGAMHGDTVKVELISKKHGKRMEAKIIEILEHGTSRLVGKFDQVNQNFGFVIPDDKHFLEDIFVPSERSKGAVNGHKVVVELTDYGTKGKSPEGKIVEIIGHVGDPGVDILSIVKNYDLPMEFPEKVLNQTEIIPSQVSEADRIGRTDLRDLLMVTIDGEDAKDLDDAVSLRRVGDLYELGVHIADVTNYVQENSALDREALKRGTSVYLVDRVIPMLPHKLSNGICSLNASTDRLALSCIMMVNEKGEVVDHKIVESVICVDQRMSYTGVNAILNHLDFLNSTAKAEIEAASDEIKEMLNQMGALSRILQKKRRKRGSIDFDFPETKIILDEDGHPIEIKPYERNTATKLIEEFMLLANETVAQRFFWMELPFVYRCHENPDPERIQKLAVFIRNFGYDIKIKSEEVHPKELQKLIEKVEGTPEEDMICRLTLRSMKRAKYATVGTGHFGLACKYYCHFTSPIRRYPDLQIHRIIKESLRGKMKENRISHYEQLLPDVAKQSSEMERRADDAERDTQKLKKVEYMQNHIGEVFEGVISGISNWGIYVELPNTIEGLIHVSKLMGDFFHYDEKNYEMIGETTHKTYKLGQKIMIQVHGTDMESRTIDFVLPKD